MALTQKSSINRTSKDLYKLINDFRGNVDVRDRKHLLIKYKTCFIGNEAVDWLIKTKHVKSRDEGVKLGNCLFKMGVFLHVRDDHKFEDAHLFYRFADRAIPELLPEWRTERGIALVAHNNMKKELIEWTKDNTEQLSHHRLIATGTTGSLITQQTGLVIELMKSGPLGGDQQIGSYIAADKIDTLIFFWDPLTAQPHDSDVKALLRLAVLYNVAIAMNVSTANALICSLTRKKEDTDDMDSN